MKNSKLLLAALLLAGLPFQRVHSASPAFTDANWLGMGGIAGANGWLDRVHSDGNGNLYVTGSFTLIGDTPANGIAKWDGNRWSALGSGFTEAGSSVSAMATVGNNLYVCGNFWKVGGVIAYNVAKWDGSAWSAIGGTLVNSMNAIAAFGTNIIVGGQFDSFGGAAAKNLARWDGQRWWPMGSGADFSVGVLVTIDNQLYAGGGFTIIGGVPASFIARWDGTQWYSLGSGVDDAVGSIIAGAGGQIYVGGFFKTAGGVPANSVARWNGTSWSALGSGITGSGWGDGVGSLAVSGNNVYAAGSFQTAGGIHATNIAKWDGSSWSAMPSPAAIPTPFVSSVAIVGTNVLAAGNLAGFKGIAQWTGSTWTEAVPQTASRLSVIDLIAMTVGETNLYVGCNQAGNVTVNGVARWDGRSWSSLGTGLSSGPDSYPASALIAQGTNIFVGGTFDRAGGTSATNIARWDGSQWFPLGDGLDVGPWALAVAGTNLYAGGDFLQAGGIPANHVACWDGTQWSALGSGLNGPVYALLAVNDLLIAGGDFTTAGDLPASGVAAWTGSQWLPLGTGVMSSLWGLPGVRALAGTSNRLFVGGYFDTAGGAQARSVAMWDGLGWHPLGNGADGPVYALLQDGQKIYAGGVFDSAGGVLASGIAVWNGTAWSALGSGLGPKKQTYRGFATSLALDGRRLWVGGAFITAGGKLSVNLAAAYLVAPPGGIADAITTTPGTATVQFYGNPGREFDVLRATDLTSPIVWTKLNGNPLSPATNGTFSFTDSSAPNGKAYYRSVEK